MFLFIIAAVSVILDQITKRVIMNTMYVGESIPVIENFFYITSHRNAGAAWGILQGQMIFFYIVTVIFVVLLLWYVKHQKTKNKVFLSSAGLLLGGAIGNFIDRVRYQEVVDFLDVHIFGYDFPIFNVADVSLVIGVILIFAYTLLEERRTANERGGRQMEKLQFIITETEQDRLDKIIVKRYDEYSRTQVQEWIKDGNVLVNGEQVKGNYKCKTRDEVTIQIPAAEPLDIEAEELNLDIRYEDSDVLVVNKPKGMVVHPAPGHLSGTLVNGLMFHCKDLSGINGVMRPGIVHRIDKDTSGLLMVAKNDLAHESLVQQLVDKTVTRRYIALVHGIISHDKGTIDAPIGRDKKERKNMTVTEENAKEAVTHFHVLERFDKYTLIECQLETGRTHQIRVHMKYIGFPLVGDPKYGPKRTLDIGGQALHAAVLGFTHPRTKEKLLFEAELPENFQQLLQKIRHN